MLLSIGMTGRGNNSIKEVYKNLRMLDSSARSEVVGDTIWGIIVDTNNILFPLAESRLTLNKFLRRKPSPQILVTLNQ